MMRPGTVTDGDVRTIRAASIPVRSAVDPGVDVWRPRVTVRSARVLAQVGCLAVVAAAPLVEVSAGTALLAAQLVVAVVVSLVLLALRAAHPATPGTLRVWGTGALVSLGCVAGLHGIVHMDMERAQLGAVLALLALAGLGRMMDAYRAAGTQLDAILATLPPPARTSDTSTA